jgi:hypothetical protein
MTRRHKKVRKTCHQAGMGLMMGAMLFIIVAILFAEHDHMFATRMLQDGMTVVILGAILDVAGDFI